MSMPSYIENVLNVGNIWSDGSPILLFLALGSFSLLYLLVSCWIRHRFRLAFAKQYESSSRAESRRVGSDFFTLPISPSIFRVVQYWRGEALKVTVGTAFRVTLAGRPCLVTAAHVYEEGSLLVVEDSEGRMHDTRAEDWKLYSADAYVLDCSLSGYRRLASMPAFTVGVAMDSDVVVRSAHEKDNASVGVVRSARGSEEVAFGRVVYTGSTKPGFSGAPYLIGSTVVGFHTHGGNINTGYSMSYLDVLVRRSLRSKPEASEMLALQKSLRTARKGGVKYRRVGSGDEVEFDVGGRFYLIDADEASELLNDNRFHEYFYGPSESFRGVVRESDNSNILAAKLDALAVTVEKLAEKVSFLGAGPSRDHQDTVMSALTSMQSELASRSLIRQVQHI